MDVDTARPSGPLDIFLRADAVVLRSTWDYHYALADFFDWLDALEQRTLVFNQPGLVRWT